MMWKQKEQQLKLLEKYMEINTIKEYLEKLSPDALQLFITDEYEQFRVYNELYQTSFIKESIVKDFTLDKYLLWQTNSSYTT